MSMHARTSVALTCTSATRRSLSTAISIPARQQQQHSGLRSPRSVPGIINISSWVPSVLEAKSWGTHFRSGTTVGDAACRSMLILVVLLLWFSCCTAPTTHIASANNSKQQCRWSSMSIGSSGSTAVNSAALVAAPLGLAVLACRGHRL